ncbi:hypothetical protein A2960_00135 [Candidatus Gottesmanbacteria bacterium RIFCSPLOWO2_01_FULL_39_12b]|uniref:Phage holin family protein n=1 Tax=Candidatus Gottesmanbacteria bacterium RIFCSPLOWO2_01_FULL_39_12b TaxID=1798388 RepID=A0A1F6ARP3_9BACT|nr:MAG: hypothetical protein A2960_00135 [Candidatus Gottesmanbacteria bacterium RIFCSPLOWO2_01_FULL_39_12b]
MKKVSKNQKANTKLWALIFLLNGILIYLGSVILPDLIVLGNAFLPNWLGAAVTSLLLTAILSQVEPVIKALNLKISNDLFLGVVYGGVNIVGLWILARIAEWSGFGIASVYVAVVLGIVLDLAQYGSWLKFGKKSGK